MIHHYLDLGPEKTNQVAANLDFLIERLEMKARKGRLTEEEEYDLVRLTDDWEMTRVAQLSFQTAADLMARCMARAW